MSDDVTRIRQALWKIEACWAAMFPEGPPSIRAGTVGRSQGKPLLTPAPTMRNANGAEVDVAPVLASWALIVADDLDLHPTVHCGRPRRHVRVPFAPVLVCGCGIAPGSSNLAHRLPATDTVAVARFLAVHADYLATLPDAADEVQLAALAVERVAEPPSALQFVGPCEVCGGDLRSRGGVAICRECRAVVDAETTRERLVDVALDRIMPASEIVTLAPRLWDATVTAVHMSRWVKRGELTSAGKVMCEDGAMRDGYRVRDVEVLVSRMSARRTA